MEITVLSVSEINQRIKSLLDGDPVLSGLAVRGELSNYKIYPSGHHYFTLKDADSSLRCVMFKSAASRLRFKPENGMGVTAVGRVTAYPRDGAYQLYCEGLMPEGVGDLSLAFEQLKEKLSKEGLFDSEHKKPIPKYPERIAVITSSAGAAVRDIIRVLGKRWPLAEVLVLPVRVQGQEAPPEIAGALRYANRWKLADLIITGRGGGSMEDLWAFNDERVARAVFESEIPVISAVGHEPDITICDYVADLRAATPSNGAELAVPDGDELSEALDSIGTRLAQAVKRQLDQGRGRLEELSSRRCLTDPGAYVDMKRQRVDGLTEQMFSRFERRLEGSRREFVRLVSSLDALSPLRVLGRGYAVATDRSGAALTDAGQVAPGDRLCLYLNRGGLDCIVDKVNKEDEGGLLHGK